jgi:hypothetical protein
MDTVNIAADRAEAEQIREAHWAASAELWGATYDQPADRTRRIAARKRFDSAYAEWKSLQARELNRIASVRGWSVSKKAFSVESLRTGKRIRGLLLWHSSVIDHPEFFLLDDRPIAICSHSYLPWSECESFATANELTIERLASSWYSELTTAALFARQDGAAP